MKKNTLLLIIALLVIIIFNGCEISQTKTYSLESAQDFCLEITTSDPDIQNGAENAGYIEDACPSSNRVGTCKDNFQFGGETFDTIYYETYVSSTQAENLCILSDGNWIED